MRYARLGLRVLFACAAAASCIGMLMAWSAGNRELGRILRLVACVSPVLLALPHRVRGGVAGPGHRLHTVRHRLRRAAPAGRRRPALAA